MRLFTFKQESESTKAVKAAAEAVAERYQEAPAVPEIVIPDLTRNPIRALDGEIADLAIEARDVLGYRGLAIAAKVSPLAMALKKLGIEPFDGDAVAAYKIAKRQQEVSKVYAQFGWFTRASWTRYALNEYVPPIPEFVLRKAIQIKRECPTVELFIDQIELHSGPDPFLVAHCEGELYYIEVWDEPKFEAAL